MGSTLLNERCRTCLEQNQNLKSIFAQVQNCKFQRLNDMLLECTAIQIMQDDGLPLLMCDLCISKLCQAYTFREQCKDSENKLKEYLLQLQQLNNKSDYNNSNAVKDDERSIDNEVKEFNYGFLDEQQQQYKNVPNLPPTSACNFPGNVRTDDQLDIPEQITECNYSNFLCKICNRNFTTMFKLKQHITGHKSKTCRVCNRTFTRASDVRRHMTTHTGSKPYTCELCDKSFTQAGTLRQHKSKKHGFTEDGQKPPTPPPIPLPSDGFKRKISPHLCNVCGKIFNTRNCFTIHLRRHNNDKPFKCTYCDMSFVTSGRLTQHTRVHTGERPYVCRYCGKSFGHYQVYKLHITIHTGEKNYQCDVCGKAFNAHYTLNIHKRKHTGEKPHECSYCKRKFSDPKVLKQHLKVHTKEKSYVCNVCGKGFTRTHHLKHHMKKHQNN